MAATSEYIHQPTYQIGIPMTHAPPLYTLDAYTLSPMCTTTLSAFDAATSVITAT